MNYTLSELIDDKTFKTLLNNLYLATNINCTIMDKSNEILYCSTCTSLCSNFHNVNATTNKRCINSMNNAVEQIKIDKKAFTFQCENGLMNVGSPIIVNGNYIATVFICQFLNWHPDLDFFTKQAQTFGFDEYEYIKAIKSIPVTSIQKIKPAADFISNLTRLVAELGLKNLMHKKSNKKDIPVYIKNNFNTNFKLENKKTNLTNYNKGF